MAFENISTDDFFPLFKQTLADSFKVDSFFMHAPYHDFEKMDMGLRRMVWGEYSTNSPIFSIAEDSPYRIVVLESTLGFYNMIISLTADEEPDLIGIMPFRTEPTFSFPELCSISSVRGFIRGTPSRCIRRIISKIPCWKEFWRFRRS